MFIAALLLALQFGISTEMFATSTFWGTVVFLVALALTDAAGRTRMAIVARHLAAAYTLAAILLAHRPHISYLSGRRLERDCAAGCGVERSARLADADATRVA